tara:strand:- start:3719 stop:5539 length:1821 start_codon:yes stop_codon:yes gene_type:complete
VKNEILSIGSLVLYKSYPAKVLDIGEKIDIEIKNGKRKKVREKDIILLHPGPISDFELDLDPQNIEEAWEILQGENPELRDLAELIFGCYSPKSAWSSWKLIEDGLYFSGSIDSIQVTTPNNFSEKLSLRKKKEKELEDWEIFRANIEKGNLLERDKKRLFDVERFALGTSDSSNILKKLGIKEKVEIAHKFLIDCKFWDVQKNPWPARSSINLNQVKLDVPIPSKQIRLDLTSLKSFAIDGETTEDPDDAISLDGKYIWVHIADVAAIVKPEGEIDAAARERSSNLYLPNFTRFMLPPKVTTQIALGLSSTSSALSIGFYFDGDTFHDIQVKPSKIKVTRETYTAVNQKISDEPFASLLEITSKYKKLREKQGAVSFDLPEASVKIIAGEVQVDIIDRGKSHDLVSNAMIMAGEAVAIFSQEQSIPIPYITQDEPEEVVKTNLLSDIFMYRKMFKPSKTSSMADRHFGLGLNSYCRSTSPLRRYADLLVHQQVRAFVTRDEVMKTEEINIRISQIDFLNSKIRKVERQSNLHFKLIYLSQNKSNIYEAVIVKLEERKAFVFLPELSLETKILKKENLDLNQTIFLQLVDVNIPSLEANFRQVEKK